MANLLYIRMEICGMNMNEMMVGGRRVADGDSTVASRYSNQHERIYIEFLFKNADIFDDFDSIERHNPNLKYIQPFGGTRETPTV